MLIILPNKMAYTQMLSSGIAKLSVQGGDEVEWSLNISCQKKRCCYFTEKKCNTQPFLHKTFTPSPWSISRLHLELFKWC